MPPARPLHTALPLVALLTLVWGTNWPLFSIAVREVSVWTFRGVSLAGAGLFLLLWAHLRGLSLKVPREHWATLVAAGLVYLAIWNVASTYAAVLIPSGQAAILGFTMPLWAALAAWALMGQRLDRRTGWAIALGGLGVALLMWRGADAYARAPLGFALGLLAAIGWAGGTLIIKRWPVPAHPLVLTGWQLLIAAVPLGITALVRGGEWFMPGATTWLVIAYITLVPMAIGNAAWFAIVGLLPANTAGLASVGVPVVAMVAGAVLHDEPLGPVQWAAAACCVGGLVLVLWRPRPTS